MIPLRSFEICWIVDSDASPRHWVAYALAMTDLAVVVCPFVDPTNWNTYSSATTSSKTLRHSFSRLIVGVSGSSVDMSKCWFPLLMVRGIFEAKIRLWVAVDEPRS